MMMRSAFAIAVAMTVVCTSVEAQDLRWEAINEPLGAPTSQLLPIGRYELIAVSARGVYRSSDDGNTWALPDSGLRPMHAHVTHGRNRDLYAIQSIGESPTDDVVQLHFSSDGGRTWRIMRDTSVSKKIGSLAIDSATGDVFVSTELGIFRHSRTASRSWLIHSHYGARAMHAVRGDLYIETHGEPRLYHLRANRNFDTTLVIVPLDPYGPNRDVFAVTPDHTLYLWRKDVLHRSTDGGGTWVIPAMRGLYRQPNGLWKLVADRSGALIYIHVVGRMRRSTDGGDSWTSLEHASERLIQPPVAFGSDGIITAVATLSGQGVTSVDETYNTFRSTDNGATWSVIGFNNAAHNLTSVVKQYRQPVFAYGSTFLTRSLDRGRTWQRLQHVLMWDKPKVFLPAPGWRLYAAVIQYGWIDRSMDGGITWARIETPEDAGILSGVADPDGRAYFGASRGKIWICDPDSTRVVLSIDLPDLPEPFAMVRAMAIDSSGGIIAAAGTHVYRSSDKGRSWLQMSSTESAIVSMAVSRTGSVHAINEKHTVLRSDDGLRNWLSSGPAAPGTERFSHIVASPHGPMYLASKYRGVFRSTDDGLTWTQHARGLEAKNVTRLAFDDNGSVFAATAAGLYIASEPLLTVEHEPSRSTGLRISSVVPQPARGVVAITLEAQRTGSCVLTLHDNLGRRIQTQSLDAIAGANTITLDLSVLARGLYVVRIDVGGESDSRVLAVR